MSIFANVGVIEKLKKKKKKNRMANNVDSDEMARDESSRLDLHSQIAFFLNLQRADDPL